MTGLPGGFEAAYMREAARVVPSAAQLDWYAMEQYAFIHFGVNTFTDRDRAAWQPFAFYA